MVKAPTDFKLVKLPKNTFEIEVTIPWETIKKGQILALADLAPELEIKGFRKGKAPISLVKKAVKSELLLSTTLKIILPDLYAQAIKKYDLKPIMDPLIIPSATPDEQNWQIVFQSCLAPEINLDNYLDRLKAELKKDDIWVPGKTTAKTEKPKEDSEEDRQKKLSRILDWLVKNISVEVSDLIINQEKNRRISKLIESLEKLGQSLDQYLSNTGKSADQLSEEYRAQAENDLKIEFIMQQIADHQNIVISPEEIERVIGESKDESEKAQLRSQSYILANLLRRQKTLDFLNSL